MIAPRNPRRPANAVWAVAALILAGSIIMLGLWWARRPVEVSVTKPVLTPVMETIASSGLVGGVKESVIGASFNGAVLSRTVSLGDHVESGQVLAVLKNDITKARVVQAESAVETAAAQLQQVSRGPLPFSKPLACK